MSINSKSIEKQISSYRPVLEGFECTLSCIECAYGLQGATLILAHGSFFSYNCFSGSRAVHPSVGNISFPSNKKEA